LFTLVQRGIAYAADSYFLVHNGICEYVTSLPLKGLPMLGLAFQGTMQATGFVPVLFLVVVLDYFLLVF